MKKYVPFFAAVFAGLFVFTPLAFAGSIHTWTTNERLKSADLNSNFQHIHNALVGGTHTAIVNADLSGSAAIAHSKLATPALVPKAWGRVTSLCNVVGACTVGQSSKITSISYSTTGVNHYDVVLAYTPTNANFAVLAQMTGSAGEFGVCVPYAHQTSSPHFKVQCYLYSAATFGAGSGTAVATQVFSVFVFDTNNY
jgi:hypothetical protein